jgi:hypothetical protein
MLLTSGDVCRLTGIALNTLDRWVASGFLSPANKGKGTGRHRIYTLGEAVAVAAGLKYREQGAGPDRVQGVVRLLAGMPLERLEAELAAGNTFPVPAMLLGDTPRPDCWLPGMMIRPPHNLPVGAAALIARLDLRVIVLDVRQKAEVLARQPAKQKRGHKRAGANKRKVK